MSGLTADAKSTRMTHLCHSTINFAVMHNAHFYDHVVGCDLRAEGPMRRREFITLLGGAAAAWPRAAWARQPPMPVVGFLSSRLPHVEAETVNAIQQGLREAGFIEHRNIGLDYRWAEGHHDRLPSLAADLVNRQVAVIIAITTPSALAAKAASNTIPIVFSIAGDPVELGLVASLNKPGGNITGASQIVVGLVAKRLEFIHDLVPTSGAVALLENPNNPIARSETELCGTRPALLACNCTS